MALTGSTVKQDCPEPVQQDCPDDEVDEVVLGSAVTLTIAQLSASLRLGDTAEETAESTRLLSYATEAVSKHAPGAPAVVLNEAVVRLASYLFDMPNAGRGDGYANAMRNSGAGRILLPYVVHRAGTTRAV